MLKNLLVHIPTERPIRPVVDAAGRPDFGRLQHRMHAIDPVGVAERPIRKPSK